MDKHDPSMDGVIEMLKRLYSHDSVQVLSVIFRKGNTDWKQRISMAENELCKTSGRVSTHAEENALKRYLKISNAPKKIDILVVRFSKKNRMGISRPCRHCLLRINEACRTYGVSVGRIFYSTNGDIIVSEKFNRMLESDRTYTSNGFSFKALNR